MSLCIMITLFAFSVKFHAIHHKRKGKIMKNLQTLIFLFLSLINDIPHRTSVLNWVSREALQHKERHRLTLYVRLWGTKFFTKRIINFSRLILSHSYYIKCHLNFKDSIYFLSWLKLCYRCVRWWNYWWSIDWVLCFIVENRKECS